jgi:hypothetical protein
MSVETEETTKPKLVKCTACTKTKPPHQRLVRKQECWFRNVRLRQGSGCTSGKASD